MKNSWRYYSTFAEAAEQADAIAEELSGESKHTSSLGFPVFP